MTTRRDLLAALGAGTLALPLASFAQPAARVRRIGYLDVSTSAFASTRVERLRAGLRDLGYAEGKTFTIEHRWAEGDYSRLASLAAQLVQTKVEVIVAAGTPAINAARRATASVPIVMTGTGDPVASGFVKSLARPEGNITGLTNINVDVSSKYLELLRAAIPKLSRVAVLLNPDNPNHRGLILPSIQASAKGSATSVTPFQLSSASQVETVLGKVKEEGVGAMMVLADGLFYSLARRIAAHAVEQRLPTIFPSRDPVEAGGLMGYGQNLGDHFYRAATYVDKILKGAKPGDLPVEQSTKIELVINLKTAKAIGLTIPQNLLFRADKVIE